MKVNIVDSHSGKIVEKWRIIALSTRINFYYQCSRYCLFVFLLNVKVSSITEYFCNIKEFFISNSMFYYRLKKNSLVRKIKLVEKKWIKMIKELGDGIYYACNPSTQETLAREAQSWSHNKPNIILCLSSFTIISWGPGKWLTSPT